MDDTSVAVDEFVDLFWDIKQNIEPLEQAHRIGDDLSEDEIAALDWHAAVEAATLRKVGDYALAEAIASGFPAGDLGRLTPDNVNPAAAFAYQAYEAAAAFVAYGLYSPAEAMVKAERAGLVWLTTIGQNLRTRDDASDEIRVLMDAARRAEEAEQEARREALEAGRKLEAKNATRSEKAAARRKEAMRIMGGQDVSPSTFISRRTPGWQELCRLYQHDPLEKLPTRLRVKMSRDWDDMQKGDDLLA